MPNTNPNRPQSDTKPQSAGPTPALARMIGENDPFTVLGAVTPKGKPTRALLAISDERRSLLTERDALRAENAKLRSACEGAEKAVEDYIMRIEKHGFQPTFGRGVLAEIRAALRVQS